jgi:hypothetical protein
MKRMNKKLHVWIYVTSLVLPLLPLIALGVVVLLELDRGRTGNIILDILLYGGVLIGLQYFIVQMVYYYYLLAKMWGALQDGQTEITVGKAIGFLFIPVYNIYWIFRAWGSFPEEYNSFVARHRLNAPQLSPGVYSFYPIFMLLAGILAFPMAALPFVFIKVITKTCDAVNALSDAFEQQRMMPANPMPNQFGQFQPQNQFMRNI